MPLALDRLDDRTAPAVLGTTSLAFDQGGTNADTAAAVAVQADGKIVVVGTAVSGPTDTDFAIARFNPDGSLDTTFGVGGQRVIGFDLGGGNIDRATSVAIDGNGNIVVAGTAQVSATDFDFAVCRLLPNGDLDATFDADGREEVAFDKGGANVDTATGVAIDAQNRVVLAGTVQADATDTDFGIARLTNAGILDATFGSGGTQVIGFDLGGANKDVAAAVAVDRLGRIVVGGTVQVDATDTDFALARLTTAGDLDATFDTDGRATVAFDMGGTNVDTLAGFVVLNDLSLIVAGTVTADAAGDTDIGLARLEPDGSLAAATYGTNGRLVVGFDRGGANRDTAAAITLDRNSAVTVAATVETATAGDTDLGLLRVTANGTIDAGFSPDGREILPLDQGGTNADTAAGIVALPNDRLAVVGTAATATAGDTDIGLVRFSAGTGLSASVAVGGPADGRVQRFLAGTSSGQVFETVFDSGVTVRPTIADVNGDGTADIVAGVGPGGGSEVLIRLSGGATPTDLRFDAFEPSFTGGVFVAAADIDGDGQAEVIVSPDRGGGGRVQIFGVQNGAVVLLDNFFGIDDPDFRGGARVAAGDVDGDGLAEVVVGAGFLGGPRVAVFDGAGLLRNQTNPPKLVGDFFAFPGDDATRLRNGVFLTVGDLTGDGRAELIFGGGPGGGPRVLALDGATVASRGGDAAQAAPVLNFFVANDGVSRGGVRVSVADVDGDSFADLLTASGEDLPARVRTYANPFGTMLGVEPAGGIDLFPFGGATIAGGVFVG